MNLHGTLVRGGTSKCWIFDAAQIDRLDVGRDEALLAAFGAEDPGQLDGVGGATSTTSKAAIVGPSARPDCDVDYTFAQVGIGVRRVEWSSNCGNCATAVGLYAVQSRLVAGTDPTTVVRIHNTNTGTVAETAIATPGGAIPFAGSARVPGVAQPGVAVELSFLDAAGGTTGHLLPTGHAIDVLRHGSTLVRATFVDAGAPCALLAAEDLGLTGTESPRELSAVVGELVSMRRTAALAMGLVREHDPINHAIPKVGILGAPAAYRTTDGQLVDADDYDLSVRMLSMHAPHPAIGLTSAVAVASAAALPHTLPTLLGRRGNDSDVLRVGTAAGVVAAQIDAGPDGVPRRVALSRAARCIATADLHLPTTERLLRPVTSGPDDHARTA